MHKQPASPRSDVPRALPAPCMVTKIVCSVGGVVTIAIDRAALDEASADEPDVGTVDGFVERMVEADMFDDVAERCTLEVTLTDTSNLQIALTAIAMQDAEFCNQKSEVRSLLSMRAAPPHTIPVPTPSPESGNFEYHLSPLKP